MAVIDVFNGDADGLCALVQLRNAEPVNSQVVTGVKRDIALVAQAGIKAGDQVTVLDISYDKNRDAVNQALQTGASIFYVDHHFAGDITEHTALTTIINPAADVCTAILVNNHLQGRFVEWAITGAYGDNLNNSAEILAKPLGLSTEQLQQLQNLGVYLNYNGYGSGLDDLHFTPADLFEKIRPYASPFDFIAAEAETFQRLEQGYHQDMAAAAAIEAEFASEVAGIFVLPNEKWARRVSGVYSNDLANANPDRAHAVLTEKANGNYLVSVRAPLNNKTGADEIVRQFPTGGGRKAAAGINDLPAEQLAKFIATLTAYYS
jgi:single-stranded DNA-specific DHH superfamily exonuclease